MVPTTDVVLPPTPEPSSTSGCEPEDFPPAPAEAAVALVQRGTCTYQQKVDNAAAAGYAAVLIFNEGQPGRQEVVQATLGTPVTIPAAHHQLRRRRGARRPRRGGRGAPPGRGRGHHHGRARPRT